MHTQQDSQGSGEAKKFVSQVSCALLERLDQKRPSLAEIALALNMSERSLQRRLLQERSSYSALLNQSLFERASKLLLNSSKNVNQISEELHYSDPAHFVRAFKKVSGKSPAQFRLAENGNSRI